MSDRSRAGRWRGRPWLAASLRRAAQVIPIALCVAFVYAASVLVPAPAGSHVRFVAWWAALSALATLVFVGVGRFSRRLLPLAALMKLSLVFPDSAPSRFQVALGSGTVASLEERLADARRGVAAGTPTEAAERLLALVALLDTHDALTCGHSERVRAYSQSIGRELCLDGAQLDLLNWAALLHDVGKLDVPRDILTKQGKPTGEEWESLREHPAAGARLASPLGGWLGEWADAIDQHHEWWDGTGYPRGLAGEEISLAGRIVAVADVFDVITSSRTYKQPSTPTAARREITRCAGSQFDPEIVRAFLAISVRRGRLAAAVAWLANSSVLGRIPTQAARTLAAAALAVGVSASAGLASQMNGSETPLPEHSRYVPASPATGSWAASVGVPTRPSESSERGRAPVAQRIGPARTASTRASQGRVPPEEDVTPNDTSGALTPSSARPAAPRSEVGPRARPSPGTAPRPRPETSRLLDPSRRPVLPAAPPTLRKPSVPVKPPPDPQPSSVPVKPPPDPQPSSVPVKAPPDPQPPPLPQQPADSPPPSLPSLPEKKSHPPDPPQSQAGSHPAHPSHPQPKPDAGGQPDPSPPDATQPSPSSGKRAGAS